MNALVAHVKMKLCVSMEEISLHVNVFQDTKEYYVKQVLCLSIFLFLSVGVFVSAVSMKEISLHVSVGLIPRNTM